MHTLSFVAHDETLSDSKWQWLCAVGRGLRSGETIEAVAGRFSRSAVFSNRGIKLGREATYEDLMGNIDEMRDMSESGEGRGWKMKKQ